LPNLYYERLFIAVVEQHVFLIVIDCRGRN
jgi:hypothetical protein